MNLKNLFKRKTKRFCCWCGKVEFTETCQSKSLKKSVKEAVNHMKKCGYFIGCTPEAKQSLKGHCPVCENKRTDKLMREAISLISKQAERLYKKYGNSKKRLGHCEPCSKEKR
jgi:hypothetical protein